MKSLTPDLWSIQPMQKTQMVWHCLCFVGNALEVGVSPVSLIICLLHLPFEYACQPLFPLECYSPQNGIWWDGKLGSGIFSCKDFRFRSGLLQSKWCNLIMIEYGVKITFHDYLRIPQERDYEFIALQSKILWPQLLGLWRIEFFHCLLWSGSGKIFLLSATISMQATILVYVILLWWWHN